MTIYRRKHLRRLPTRSSMSIAFDGEDMNAGFLIARGWCVRLAG